ncbi:hypothetical protein LCGC14_2928360, partial [marine sediment metagenome]
GQTMTTDGAYLSPELSFDGKQILFGYTDTTLQPRHSYKWNEDNTWHIFRVDIDGTNLVQMTDGPWNDFDPCFLPSGRIAFISERRGGYGRCHGRPVPSFTLHSMNADGSDIVTMSPHETNEWQPSVDHNGMIVYTRWDYVDRSGQPYMSLWSTMPDGTQSRLVFGNHARKPLSTFEPASIPGSQKIVFTAAGHHSVTGGSLVLLDPTKGSDGQSPLTRLTPEVSFPEIEGWPDTFYANPHPLSEDYYLVAWSNRSLAHAVGPSNGLGIYLFDAFGNLTLIHRDAEISSMYPLPIRPRRRPEQIASQVDWDGEQEGRMLLVDVYRGLPTISPGTIRRLRLVGIPPKTHPVMNNPPIGMTHDDPGKFVLGTVPVEADGSAYF